MLSKLNTKTLVVLLVIMIALFAFLYYSDNTESSYKSEIVNLDTAAVNRVVFYLSGKDTVELTKDQNNWQLVSGNGKADADNNKVKALLNRMAPLKTMRLATNNKDHWKKYGVAEDDQYSAIRFYNGNKLLSEVILGKVDYQAPETDEQNPYMKGNQGIMIGYARTNGDEDVYVIDGYLKLTFTGNADGYRKKEVIRTDPAGVTEVVIKSGDAGFTLSKKDNKWYIDGVEADSANTTKFINNISRLYGYNYYTPKDIENIKPVGTALVKTDNGTITVDAFAVDSADMALVSSMNRNNVIKDKKGKAFEKLFKKKDYFFGKE